MLGTLRIDLDAPADQRWSGLAAHAAAARALVASYTRDLGGLERWAGPLLAYRAACLDAEVQHELAGVARAIGASDVEVLASNLYYDALKVALGCTAFAAEGPAGPLLARNLDWWSDDHLLARTTLIVEAVRGGQVVYRTVGWPGFVGCLSGVAPGRFAVTLNAVLSSDPPALAAPVVLVLRDALATAPSFVAAVERLAAAPIASDCLLLVTGTRPGEAIVIERTPTRAALRHAGGGPLVVTNDYRALTTGAAAVTALAETSCGRHDRAAARAAAEDPREPDACFAILADPAVRMNMTVQHMVLDAVTGAVHLRAPAG
jgi:acid ceramidase